MTLTSLIDQLRQLEQRWELAGLGELFQKRYEALRRHDTVRQAIVTLEQELDLRHMTTREKLPDGYEMMIRPADDHHDYDSCTRCGEQIAHGEQVYFQCSDEWYTPGIRGQFPYCSLDCAHASREDDKE